MRNKQDIEKEFNEVKINMEQAQQVVQNCTARLCELRGQFQMLEEKEPKEEIKKT